MVAQPLASALSVPALAHVWWLLALTTLLVGAFQVLSSWIVREQRYNSLGLRNAAQGGGTAITQMGLGALGHGSVGLLLGQATGYAVALGGFASSRGLLRQPLPDTAGMRRVLRRYRRFPLVSTWSALLNTAGLQAPLLVISAMYGQVIVGLLGLTMRVLTAPLVLIGRSVAQAFFGEASAESRVGGVDLVGRIRATCWALLAVGAIPTVALSLFGPRLFGLIFGQPWSEAGHYAQLLAAGFLAQLVVSPVSQTLLLLERQAAQLAWDAARLAMTVAVPTVCASLGASADISIGALSAALVVTYLALLWTCLRSAGRVADFRPESA